MTTPFSPGDPNRPGNKAFLGKIAALVAIVGTIATVAVKSTGTTPVTAPPADTTHVDSTPVVTPPVGAGLSGVQTVGDDYSQYKTTADLLAKISTNVGGTCTSSCIYGDGRGAQYVTIDSTVLYNGHHTVRYSFVPGAANNPPELYAGFPGLDDVWMRAVIRFAPGWTTIGNNAAASNAYKLLAWNLAGVDGSGRIEITNTTQYEIYWGASVKNTSTPIETEQFAVPGNVTTEWSDGRWRAYTIHWQKTSDSTVDVECWVRVAGDTAGLYAKTTTKMLAGHLPPQVNAFNLGMNYNQPIMAPMAINYGQWEVVDGSKHPNPFNLTAK